MPQPRIDRIVQVAQLYADFAGLWRTGDDVHVAFVNPADAKHDALLAEAPEGCKVLIERARWTWTELQQASQIIQNHMSDRAHGITVIMAQNSLNQVTVGVSQAEFDQTRLFIESELDRAGLTGTTDFVVSEGLTEL